MNKTLIKNIFSAIIVVILLPMVYVTLLNEVVSHPGLNLSTQWSDLTLSENWHIDMSTQIDGNISSENGVLKITMDGYLQEGDIITAQRKDGLPNNITSDAFLKVTIKTSSVNVAARVLVWSNETYDSEYQVLVKTFKDQEWHTEIIDLSVFHFSEVYMIELSMMQVYPSNSSEWVSYSNLSFEKMEI